MHRPKSLSRGTYTRIFVKEPGRSNEGRNISGDPLPKEGLRMTVWFIAGSRKAMFTISRDLFGSR